VTEKPFMRNNGQIDPHVIASSSPAPANDPVSHPPHYTQGGIECIDAIAAALSPEGFQAFLRGQVIKYMWRAPHKENALQDTRKAIWYAERLASSLEAAPGSPPVSHQGI